MTQNMLGKDALIPNHNINLDTWCTVLMQVILTKTTVLGLGVIIFRVTLAHPLHYLII